jgi:SOS-response transcriptional repressor LexA
MALNPIAYTEKVVRSFLRYQLTSYPFADERLHRQMRELLSLDKTRESPLMKGPYVSLSRPFRQGASIDQLVREGVFHPHMRQRIPAAITHVYGHQEEAIRSIHAGSTTLVSTGTGSGKSECFLYPIVSKCLELLDSGAPAGISAVIVYPMNALAEDQLQRLRSLLASTGIPFGMYVGKTPETESGVAGVRLPAGSSRADYEKAVELVRREQRSETVYPPEEVCSREVMRTRGRQPRILLTNVKQLELLLTRQRDVELFGDARLDFLVFDEAHTFTGAQGAETACLIRRLRNYCGRSAQETVCVATSATIADPRAPDAAREFASRFFGVPKDGVTTVGESYAPEVWAGGRSLTPAPKVAASDLLNECVKAVESHTAEGREVRSAWKALTGAQLPDGDWSLALHGELSKNEIAYQLSELLAKPRRLDDLSAAVGERVGRPVPEAEVLSWLTLGAAARREGRPLLRPIVHGFIRGISGAVVSFPAEAVEPVLWLAAEDEVASAKQGQQHAHFPLTTCTTCGQHYYVTYLQDFEFAGRQPGGGQAAGDSGFWEPLDESHGGTRVVLVDGIVGGSDDEDLDSNKRTAALHFCRRCGAAHRGPGERCLHCSHVGTRVELHAIKQSEDHPGFVSSCLSCGTSSRSTGTRYRESARPVRATNVADVHVLAQDMIQHAERPRLLVFCDNRQDAAFQAGWMKDHARRFRLRSLMAEGLTAGPQSVGDLTRYVDDVLEKDEALSRALIPEVWQVQRREGGGGRHEQERRKYLRIQVLREVTLSARQSIGLEPWGRMRVEYQGLDVSWAWIQDHARRLGMPPEDLREGVASMLDYLRRKRALHDRERAIFGQYWMDGDLEIQQGYLPQLRSPCATKLRRAATEKAELVAQWVADTGDTTFRQIAKKWGVPPDEINTFLEGLFDALAAKRLLTPVTLKGSKGKPLPNISGVYQIDGDQLRLQANSGVWRCAACRRRSPRRTPFSRCPAWRCDGVLEYVREDSDDYNLQVLDQSYTMLRPEEHTAMVPHDERERLENLFKGDSEAVNAFVCTPTLELGVDIGQLDSVLMRNVPPLPANYWQRAGRAGRRHRMAVNLTYCRPVSHDRAYFAEPLKLLAGRVDPPAFNLRNELMVAKHVHASVITRLHQYVRDPARQEHDRGSIDEILKRFLPSQISPFLFDLGEIRTTPFNFEPLRGLVSANIDDLVSYVARAFSQGWPASDSTVVTGAALRAHVEQFVPQLEGVVQRLTGRLRWAMAQITRLTAIQLRQGDLEKEDKNLRTRCESLIARMKGARRGRREAEGYDDSNTFGVLAAEGFLPGYGLESGSILGTAEIPYWRTGALEFSLPRAPSVALREYVPGNLIYANGNRFVARRFHRDVDEQRIEMPNFEVSLERQAVKPTSLGAAGTTLGGMALQAIAVCDVDLLHQSHISDDEELRFQLGVSVFGYERKQHTGGQVFNWGPQPLHHRRGVRLRLVNVGASSSVQGEGGAERLGYPVCTVCGQSVSPLSSQLQLEKFNEGHKDRCHRAVTPVGFYADVVADALSLPACADRTTAYTVLEAIRVASTQVLDMHMEDLQLLVIGHVDRDDVDALLWDPMPGGSGLLDQILERFAEIVDAARDVCSKCPSACATSCIDCLQTFRNSYYHKHLDRTVALACLDAWGRAVALAHEIPPEQPSDEPREGSQPVNNAERRLRRLLRSAGFEEGLGQQQLKLDRSIGTTTPDVIYRAPHHGLDEGICIYLDGLSDRNHGDPQTREQDQRIRSWLRGNGWEVIEISAHDLGDQEAMTRHFRKLAGYLQQNDLRSTLSSTRAWFDGADDVAERARPELRIVRPEASERYVKCVPLVPLQAAASGFSHPQFIEDGEWSWIQPATGRTLRPGMFVAKVVGKSMEPLIPDGAHCLFQGPVTGSRQGRVVLVALRDDIDPETGERFTIKRYESEKVEADDGAWRHLRVTLNPQNPAFEPIVLTADDEGLVHVVAEFVEVVG